MRLAVQAKDIPEAAFVAAVRDINVRLGRWAFTDELAAALGAPEKVVRAKGRRLIERRVVSGCPCGCRGDWEAKA